MIIKFIVIFKHHHSRLNLAVDCHSSRPSGDQRHWDNCLTSTQPSYQPPYHLPVRDTSVPRLELWPRSPTPGPGEELKNQSENYAPLIIFLSVDLNIILLSRNIFLDSSQKSEVVTDLPWRMNPLNYWGKHFETFSGWALALCVSVGIMKYWIGNLSHRSLTSVLIQPS